MSLSSFFRPQSVAVVGVSENPKKLGSIIFQNIIESGFQGSLYAINPKHDGDCLFGKLCYGSVQGAPESLDLVVVVIPGKFTPPVIDECISNGTKNIIIISAGFSEVGNKDLEFEIAEKCREHGINLLGPNCLGALFPYANLNASFSQGFPERGNVAFISQSGAFCTAMLDWAAQKGIGFSHFISLGNKAGIHEVELVESFANDPHVEVIVLYLESLADGKHFLEVLKNITPHKPVVILEPGKSKAAQEASASHTGSLSPNSRVLQYAYQSSGVLQVFSMQEMFSLVETLVFYSNRSFGNRIAIVTNAGGAGVMSSDLVEDNNLELARLSESTIQELKNCLPEEANTHNPIDIIGDADSKRYDDALRIALADESVDQVLVLLTPQRTTEVVKTAELIGEQAGKTEKPVFASFIGGKETSKGLPILERYQVPSFPFPAGAIRVMGLLAHKEKNILADPVRESTRWESVADLMLHEKAVGNKMISEDLSEKLSKNYELPLPLAGSFTEYSLGLTFAESIFPNAVVLKISSPDAIHKTDLKGVFLNIDNAGSFKDAWDNLMESIKIASIPNASIQIQEQIKAEAEVIVGVNTDVNFGKVLLFGSGGVYTEVFADTSLRILPTQNIEGMIDETKIGTILKGVRGKDPLAIGALVDTINKIQNIALDYPEITSIDANPILVTKDRAVCVDLKFLL